jgi:protein-S-isoprenylcysteine O-methyltransferase Ste14
MNSESIYQFVAIAFLLPTMCFSIYFRSKAARAGDKISPIEEGPLILNLRRILGLTFWLSILVYLIHPGWMAWSTLPLPAWTRWSGAVLLALCVPLFYWVFSSLGNNVTSTVAIRSQHNLVTSGPYRWVRHPLYSVGFLAFIGFSLLAANWFIFTLVVLTFSVLMKRTPIEERRLVERFGEAYRQYMRTTGRYLPRLKRSI